ncbi:hypothetical protein F0170_26610 [Pseudomonas sp. MAFF 730085]|uniref:Uncharacterized protein n=1 Tax=Pseudomonas kitaguniensis TaxID=2607908 RepID=A0A5N7K0P7_9PSED|nr:hypothetical protein [Pseudomonas kitaguniensis]
MPSAEVQPTGCIKPTRHPIFQPNSVNCGSGLARDSAVSVEKYLSDTPQSRASPLPQKRC